MTYLIRNHSPRSRGILLALLALTACAQPLSPIGDAPADTKRAAETTANDGGGGSKGQTPSKASDGGIEASPSSVDQDAGLADDVIAPPRSADAAKAGAGAAAPPIDPRAGAGAGRGGMTMTMGTGMNTAGMQGSSNMNPDAAVAQDASDQSALVGTWTGPCTGRVLSRNFTGCLVVKQVSAKGPSGTGTYTGDTMCTTRLEFIEMTDDGYSFNELGSGVACPSGVARMSINAAGLLEYAWSMGSNTDETKCRMARVNACP